MKKIFCLVEGNDDFKFIQHLAPSCILEPVVVGGKENSAVHYPSMEQKLNERLSEFEKQSELSIAIVFDKDEDSPDDILKKVNVSMKRLFEAELTKVGVAESLSLTFNGASFSAKVGLLVIGDPMVFNDLDTLLESIQSEPAPAQACLQSFFDCADITMKHPLTDREKKKFRQFYYLKYDTLTVQQRKKAEEYANVKSGIERNIWDLNHVKLSFIREFLDTFNA